VVVLVAAPNHYIHPVLHINQQHRGNIAVRGKEIVEFRSQRNDVARKLCLTGIWSSSIRTKIQQRCAAPRGTRTGTRSRAGTRGAGLGVEPKREEVDELGRLLRAKLLAAASLATGRAEGDRRAASMGRAWRWCTATRWSRTNMSAWTHRGTSATVEIKGEPGSWPCGGGVEPRRGEGDQGGGRREVASDARLLRRRADAAGRKSSQRAHTEEENAAGGTPGGGEQRG
jgi:hypothetical protein